MDPNSIAPGQSAAPAPAPAAPVAPEPAAPTAPQLTPEQQDDAEWDAVEKELFPGLKSTNKQDKKDEPTKPETTTETTAAPQENQDGEKPNAEPGTGDDAKKDSGTEEEAPAAGDADARTARQSARAYAQQVEAVKADVIKQMFADVPDTLQDADGDPIRNVEDVMKLVNPRTGETFTEEEAGMWLLSAQQKFNQQRADIEKQAERYAEVNLEIKDQADSVNSKYGAYLREHTDLRDDLWAEWSSTLEKDEKSGVIVKMPYSLEKFYDRALGPVLENAKLVEQQAAAAKAAEEQAAAEAEKKRQQTRSDRSDIYGGTQIDTRDDEDKEWDDAKTIVFG